MNPWLLASLWVLVSGAASVQAVEQQGPAARVELRLEPPSPTKGKDTSATLTVRILKADGTLVLDSAPPVLQANVGRVEQMEKVEPGVYRGRYVLPETRYPEVAMVVAFSAWPHPQSVHGSVGALRVPLPTLIELPGTTEPNTKMTLEIAGNRYGPVQSGADGRFRIPVTVPPGKRYAKATAVDAIGNAKTYELDLQIPPMDPLACVVNPRALPADGVAVARVLCAVSDASGAPVSNARIALKASKGKFEKGPPSQAGIQEWRFVAPKLERGETLTLEASWAEGGRLAREAVPLELRVGPAASIAFRNFEPVVHEGSQVTLEAEVRDAAGRARTDAVTEVRSSLGTVEPVLSLGDGVYRVVWKVPSGSKATQASLTLKTFGPPGVDPARLTAWASKGQLWAGVMDLGGHPVPAQPLEVEGRTVTTGPDGTVQLGPLRPGPVSFRHRDWKGLTHSVLVTQGGELVPGGLSMDPVEKTLEVVVAPAVPVNVRIQVAGRNVTYWAEDPNGKLLPERELKVSVSGATFTPGKPRESKQTGQVSGKTAVSLSVTDARTGVTALAKVLP